MLKFVSTIYKSIHILGTDTKTYFFYTKVTIVLLLGAVAAAPSGVYLARFGSPESPASTVHATHVAPLAYIQSPLTYAEPATLTKYNSISSPLTYTASHQPAVAYTNLATAPLGYAGYGGYAGYPVLK